MQLIAPTPFKKAVDKIGAKSPIGSKLNSSEWRDVPVALRERAFFSSTVENIRFLQRGRDAITDYLSGARETTESGALALKVGSRAEFVKQLQEFAIAEGMGPLDPEDAGGLKDITSERRLGLIFDTQTRQAQDYGYWRQGMDADVLDEFPAQRFVRVEDVNEPREWHMQFEDQVYLKTDPIWETINADFGVPWGPWGWGCGHDVEDVDRGEAESLGLVKPGEVVAPDLKGFNDRLQSSTRGLDEEMIRWLKDAFGEQVEFRDGAVRWNPRVTLPPTIEPPPAIEPLPAKPETAATTFPKLDDLVQEYASATGLSQKQQIVQTARDRIAVPEASRGRVALTMDTTSKAIRATASGGNEIVSRYTAPSLLENVKVTVNKTAGRAFHRSGGIYLSTGADASTAAHEIMHAIELQNPEVKKAAAEFLLSRGAGEKPERLSKLTGIAYGSDEVALQDKWAERGGKLYCGKVYSWTEEPQKAADIRATEILTMGIERLHEDPVEFYMRDRDYYEFVVRTLRKL